MRAPKPTYFIIAALSSSIVSGCVAEVDEATRSTMAPLQTASVGKAIPGQYIVVLKHAAGDQGVAAAVSSISFKSPRSRIDHWYTIIPGFSARLSAEDLDAIRRDPNTDYVEEDQLVIASSTKLAGADLHIDRHDHCPAEDDGIFNDNGCDGNGVLVYIVDTGIRATHTEFTGRVNTARGFTAISDGLGTADCNGHGTHVASIAAGTKFGMARAATLIPVRVLDCSGSGSTSGVIAGVNYVVGNCGATEKCVANMSLAGGVSTALDAAVAGAVSHGIPVAVAAGNNAEDAINFSPAREPSAITVGAVSDSGYPAAPFSNSVPRASFSNFGSRVDIWASGLTVLGAFNDSDTATRILSGTSMASPHVAGAIAQMLSCGNKLGPAAIETELENKAIPGLIADEMGAQDLFLCSDFNDTDGDACSCSGPLRLRIFYPIQTCQPPCENILHTFIPDDDPTGVRVGITVPAGLDIQRVTVDVDITHTFRGDLVIQVISPSGRVATLSNRAGGSADNFVVTGQDITSNFTPGSSASGQWQLFVRDLAAADVGTINSFVLSLTSSSRQ